MSSFKVQADELTRFADSVRGRTTELNKHRDELENTRVSRDSFGYLPGIGEEISAAYEGLVDRCVEAVDAAGLTGTAIAAAAENTAAAYKKAEEESANSSNQVTIIIQSGGEYSSDGFNNGPNATSPGGSSSSSGSPSSEGSSTSGGSSQQRSSGDVTIIHEGEGNYPTEKIIIHPGDTPSIVHVEESDSGIRTEIDSDRDGKPDLTDVRPRHDIHRKSEE
jgi:hypothetical protein